jgi:uncharacterized protein YjiS (DUF1127 family)
MDTHITAGTVAWRPASSRVGDAARDFARRIEGWLVARRRAADDRVALAQMSDRELADIGVPRASRDAVAGGAWTRDFGY